MKNRTAFMLAALCSLSLSFVACDQKPEDVMEPVFPETVEENDIVPGTELLLSFTPNMEWTLSVPEDNITWFWIDEDGYPSPSCSGKASESPVTVKICTRNEKSFSTQSCEVTLTMGGKSQVIAKYSLYTEIKSLSIYPASMSEGEFVMESGKYVYESEPVQQVELLWDAQERRYSFPVKIEANYEWTAQWPEWVRADLPEGSRNGVIELDLYGVASKLPLESSVAEVMFQDGSQTIEALNVTMAGCKDVFIVNTGGYYRVSYDHGGYYRGTSDNYSNDEITGFIYSPSAGRIILAEKTEGQYHIVNEPAGHWVNLTVDPWDTATGADVLQERYFTVTVSKYLGDTTREAVVLFAPATASTDDIASELFTSDLSEVAAAYRSNAIYLEQSVRPSEYLLPEQEQAVLDRTGVVFVKKDEMMIPDLDYADTPFMYELSYTKDLSASNGVFYLTDPYATVSIYNSSRQEVTQNLSDYWLSFSSYKDNLYGCFLMDSEKMQKGVTNIDGYIAFKDKNGKVMSLVHCIYVKEEKVTGDVTMDASKYFVDPDAAASDGFTLVEYVAGETYKKYENQYGAPILKLISTKNGASVALQTSTDIQLYQCMGKSNSGPEIITVDGDVYAESNGMLLKDWGEIWTDKNEDGVKDSDEVKDGYRDTYDGITELLFNKPEGVEGNVMSEIIQLFASSDILFYIICELNLSVSQTEGN